MEEMLKALISVLSNCGFNVLTKSTKPNYNLIIENSNEVFEVEEKNVQEICLGILRHCQNFGIKGVLKEEIEKIFLKFIDIKNITTMYELYNKENNTDLYLNINEKSILDDRFQFILNGEELWFGTIKEIYSILSVMFRLIKEKEMFNLD